MNVVSWLSTYPSILPHIGSGNTVSPLLQTVSTRNRCSTCTTTSRKWVRPLGIITCRTIAHLTGSSAARDFTRTRTACKLDSNNYCTTIYQGYELIIKLCNSSSFCKTQADTGVVSPVVGLANILLTQTISILPLYGTSILYAVCCQNWLPQSHNSNNYTIIVITPRACARGKVIGRVVTPRACARGQVIGFVCC